MIDSTIIKELKKIVKTWFKKSIYEFELEYINNDVYIRALNDFKLDYQNYFNSDQRIIIGNISSRPELLAILLYRISRILYLDNNLYCNHFSNLGRFLSGIEIYYSACIGTGLKIHHGIGTVIGARVTIGKNCIIHQGVTFGDKNGKRPIIGDNVTIYAGAKVLGGITIGNNAVIGANAVCLMNVPDNAVAVGIPAKIIDL